MSRSTGRTGSTRGAPQKPVITPAFGMLVLTMTLAACAPVAMPDEGMAAAIQKLTDEGEIETLLLDYGRHLDSRDFEAYSQLFASNGEWIGGFGAVEGPAAIRAFMEDAIPGPNAGNTYHLLSNFRIDVDGDQATAWSRWALVTGGTDDSPTVAQGGHYEDRIVREDGAWKFTRREAILDIPVSFSPPPD